MLNVTQTPTLQSNWELNIKILSTKLQLLFCFCFCTTSFWGVSPPPTVFYVFFSWSSSIRFVWENILYRLHSNLLYLVGMMSLLNILYFVISVVGIQCHYAVWIFGAQPYAFLPVLYFIAHLESESFVQSSYTVKAICIRCYHYELHRFKDI